MTSHLRHLGCACVCACVRACACCAGTSEPTLSKLFSCRCARTFESPCSLDRPKSDTLLVVCKYFDSRSFGLGLLLRSSCGYTFCFCSLIRMEIRDTEFQL